MSNIPKGRDDLVRLIETHFSKLQAELEKVDERDAQRMCDEDFSIKDILAVRLWWTRAVMRWVQTGRIGEVPVLPASGYNWRETPALNKKTAADASKQSYKKICNALTDEQTALLKLIDSLSEEELTRTGVFEWAGKWPVMRWISIGTSSQYDSARKLIRKAMKGTRS